MGTRTKWEYRYLKTNRGVYIGGIENKKKNGWGITINNNGNKYEGLFQNDLKHLIGSELLCCLHSHSYKQGKKNADENSEDEFAKGNICLHDNRYIYIGGYKEGKRHGNGILIDYNTYAMYSCIFLRNEMIYKDILFSSVNNFPPKCDKYRLAAPSQEKGRDKGGTHKERPRRRDKVTIEGATKGCECDDNATDGGSLDGGAAEEESPSSSNSEQTGKSKRERDMHSFIENQYKYNIFSYVHFYQQLMKKIKRENASELFTHSVHKKEVHIGESKGEKLLKSTLKNVQEKKDRNNFCPNRRKSKLPCGTSAQNGPSDESPSLKREKEQTNNFLIKTIHNKFEHLEMEKMLMEPLGKNKWVNDISNEEAVDGIFYPANEETMRYTEKGKLETCEGSVTRDASGCSNNLAHVRGRGVIHETDLLEKREELPNNEDRVMCSCAILISTVGDKLRDQATAEDGICVMGEQEEGNETYVVGKEEDSRGKESASGIGDEGKLDNSEFSQQSMETPTVVSNMESEDSMGVDGCADDGRSDRNFSRAPRVAVTQLKSETMGQTLGGESRASGGSNRISGMSGGTFRRRGKTNAVGVNNHDRKDTIRSVSCVSDGSVSRRSLGGSREIETIAHDTKNVKHKKGNGNSNPFLKQTSDDELSKEIESMLPGWLRKKKKKKCLSCAQNCVYWDVFELNFFFFFIGVPKKAIEIFVRNEIDGYCLKYMEDKLLKRMGIHDSVVKKYVILCVQFLLRLREKYKYRKRSNRINGNVQEDAFLLKKNKLHYLNLIGRGGYSNVYRCIYGDKLLTFNDDYFCTRYSTNNIALKIIINKKYRYEFCSEMDILSTLRHPNVSLFLGALKSPQGIALEYINCGSIFDLIHKHKIKIKLRDIMKMGKDIASFMCFLHHKGILHCDLKSSNILLSMSGQIKICDFGLSVQNFSQKPRFLGIVGTYQWTAPEILRAEGYTPQADVYSFGVILWEMLHREIPFRELKHPLDIIACVGYAGKELLISRAIPPPVRYMLKKCLHRNRRKRKSFFFWSEYLDMYLETWAVDSGGHGSYWPLLSR
ncbi:TKL protein kinase [Plasmodium fragile]|uniref:TKL protein kinase n=1 Tax=Plasmodium fragile TaxID=5857 RepID=A0A0D9QEL3_PLAFR|nr:TKL protein kinase [Plasmodium fragile]KJP85500.1 TKL protein kinase [Plasmodium fragile]